MISNDLIANLQVDNRVYAAILHIHMDVNEEHAQRCFQYEKIMFYSVLLEIAILSGNMVEQKKMLDHIASAAVRYGIIEEGSDCEYASIEGVCLIIDEAKTQIALYQDL